MMCAVHHAAACIINAAWALTGICAARASSPVVVGVTTRPDVFVHLSALLGAEFPRPRDKAAVFANVCRMLAPVVSKVRVTTSHESRHLANAYEAASI